LVTGFGIGASGGGVGDVQSSGEEQPLTLLATWNLSVTLHKLGMKKRAVALLQTAVSLQEKVQGITHPRTRQMKAWLDFFLDASP
jgi:hypothetical protein